MSMDRQQFLALTLVALMIGSSLFSAATFIL